jgi:hypothetical protein
VIEINSGESGGFFYMAKPGLLKEIMLQTPHSFRMVATSLIALMNFGRFG